MDGDFLFGIYISDSKEIQVCGNTFRHIARKPVMVTGNSRKIMICGCVFEENGQGGIQVNGDTADVLIEGNVIEDSQGSDNWSAGIVLTSNGIPDTADGGRETCCLGIKMDRERMLYDMLSAPCRIVIRANDISHNKSSGIYCFGPYMVYMTHNQITGNDKEGICLDFGTLGGYAAYNDIMRNGGRTRQTDQDLENDFVLEMGRLNDGSSPAKLPGISIDNSAYNMIYNNRIEENYGSGVKMVRTGIRNIISTNIINDNNRGQNGRFHFFGIELGNAAADFEEASMDYKPDYENIICRNMIAGRHYAGVFLAEGVYMNDLFDNVIMDALNWSVECISREKNNTLNNLSQVPSRGIPLSAAAVGVVIMPGMVPLE